MTCQYLRTVPTLLCLFILSVASADPVFANAAGRVGFSGQQGSTCNSCHTGGQAPLIQLTGPTTANTGQWLTLEFFVTTTNDNDQVLSLIHI